MGRRQEPPSNVTQILEPLFNYALFFAIHYRSIISNQFFQDVSQKVFQGSKPAREMLLCGFTKV